MKFEIAYTALPGCAAPIPQPGSNPHRGILSPLSPRNAACHISGFGAGPLNALYEKLTPNGRMSCCTSITRSRNNIPFPSHTGEAPALRELSSICRKS